MPNQLKEMATITILSHVLQDGDSKFDEGPLTLTGKLCFSDVPAM